MSQYSATTTAIIQELKTKEDALPLKNEACRSKFFFQPHPTEKVCLFFHGFTAGPYQFQPLGKALHAAGYNVIIPLMPGHGHAGKWDRDNPPPLPTKPDAYHAFALHWLEVAKTVGKQVIIGGLSAGGTLAAWLSLERPQDIEKTLLFAPFLSSSNPLVDFIVEVLPIYFEWLNKDMPANFGYDGFYMPALDVFLDMGQDVCQRIKKSRAVPMLIMSSEVDGVIDHKDEQHLFQALLQQQPQSWCHCFDKALKIPHTMMTKAEGNRYESLLITLIKAYLESNITWDELLEIGYQILQGKNFNAAVKTLNWTRRISPDVSILLSIMDNKTIIEAHKLKA